MQVTWFSFRRFLSSPGRSSHAQPVKEQPVHLTKGSWNQIIRTHNHKSEFFLQIHLKNRIAKCSPNLYTNSDVTKGLRLLELNFSHQISKRQKQRPTLEANSVSSPTSSRKSKIRSNNTEQNHTHTHWWCHFDRWGKFYDQNTTLNNQNSMKTNKLTNGQHKFPNPSRISFEFMSVLLNRIGNITLNDGK